MSNDYSREVLRRVVAQVCQIIGWQGINSTPLDILVHILEKYILTLCTQTNRYAEQFNRTEPNLHDLGLVFKDVHIPLQELREYIKCVPPVPFQMNVPNFPLPKESHLNFLKPGSQEVVTRPVHVHEYLPAMYPEKETPQIADTVVITQNGIEEHTISQEGDGGQSPEISVTDDLDKSKDVFKRPMDPISFTPPGVKRPRLKLEEEDSRTREISSVMMTMSGFLSPAREGKLPEARTPVMMHHHPEKSKANTHLTPTPPHSMLPSVPKSEHADKRSKKNKSLNGKVEKVKRKDKSHKNMVPGKQKNSENKINKLAMHLARGKIHPSSSVKHHNNEMPPPLKQLPPSLENNMKPVIKQELVEESIERTHKVLPVVPPPPLIHPVHQPPLPQLLRNPLAYNEPSHHKNSKVRDVPSPMVSPVPIKEERMDEEKLTSQPDRSKLNIFKKISSKVKEEKVSTSNQDRHGAEHAAYGDRFNHNIPISSGSSQVKEIIKQKMHHVNEIIDSVVSNSAVDLSPKKPHLPNDIQSNSSSKVPIKQEVLNHELKDIHKHKESSPRTGKSGHVKEKKEKKHKERKSKPDKALKEFAKMMRKSQMAQDQLKQLEQQEKMGMRIPPGLLFPGLLPNPALLPGPGLTPPGNLFSGILPNPFSLGPGAPGGFPQPHLFPGPGLIPPNLGNPLLSHIAHSFGKPPPPPSHSKLPPFFRRPSLEVIPIEENNESSSKQYISPPLVRDKDKARISSSHINNLNLNNNNKDSNISFNSMVSPSISIHQKTSPPKVNNSLSKTSHIRPDVTIKVNVPEKQKPVDLPKPKPEAIPQPVLPVELPSVVPPVISGKEKEKEKSEKKKDKLHKKEKKDKELKLKKKKDKKEKLKIKIEKKKSKEERQELKEKLKKIKKEKRKEKEREKEREKEKLSAVPEGLVPKLTLKLGSSSPMPPSSPETTRKLNIKPIVKRDEPPPSPVDPPSFEDRLSAERGPSPELARISALVTRPPKVKPFSKHNNVSKSESSSDLNSSLSPPPQQSSTSPHRKNKSSSYSRYKKIYFKPIPKKGSMDESCIDLDDDVPTPPVVNVPDRTQVPEGMPFYTDSQGNKVWICPACKQQDNGSPMIGCDGGCDCWYHWECVGIRVAPDDNEDWFCMTCKAKRAAMASALAAGQVRKKRGRKPKAEKLKEIH